MGGAILRQRAEQASRRPRGADRGAQIHHPLREIAGAQIGRQRISGRANLRLTGRQRCGDGEKPGDDPLDIGIHHHRTLAKGDGRHRRRRIGPQPRQGAQARLAIGKYAGPITGPARHRLCTGHQVAGAGIIAQPRPCRHYLALVGGGQRGDCGPALGETLEIGDDGGDGGLLQHHFRQPHPIGIGPIRPRYLAGHLARPFAPRQHAGIRVIPAQQPGGHAASAAHRCRPLSFTLVSCCSGVHACAMAWLAA